MANVTVLISRRLGIRTLEPARGGGGFGGGGRGGGRDFGRRDYGSVLRLCLKSFLWVSGFFSFFQRWWWRLWRPQVVSFYSFEEGCAF